MSVRPRKNDTQPMNPAPSVLDAVNASRGSRGEAPLAVEDETTVEEPAAAPAPAEDRPTAEHTDTASVTAALRERREKSAADLAKPQLGATPVPEGTSIDDLGRYVTQVMHDARRAASEFLASVDADAARRAATLSAQAEAEAKSLREAAVADAEKIRADAKLEADRLVAQRLRIAIDLTDRLYGQAERILADADRPDVARQNLARFVTALTQTAEEAAAASVADESASTTKPRG